MPTKTREPPTLQGVRLWEDYSWSDPVLRNKEGKMRQRDICCCGQWHPSGQIEWTFWSSLFLIWVLYLLDVQSLSHVQLFVNSCTAAHQASLSFTISWNLLKPMSIELVIPSNHLILSCLHLLLPSIFSSIRVFSNELALCIWWPKYCNFSISPSSEYSEFISFRIDWFDLLAIQGSLKSLF